MTDKLAGVPGSNGLVDDGELGEITTGAAQLTATWFEVTVARLFGSLSVAVTLSVPALAAERLNVAAPWESVVAIALCPASGPEATLKFTDAPESGAPDGSRAAALTVTEVSATAPWEVGDSVSESCPAKVTVAVAMTTCPVTEFVAPAVTVSTPGPPEFT